MKKNNLKNKQQCAIHDVISSFYDYHWDNTVTSKFYDYWWNVK